MITIGFSTKSPKPNFIQHIKDTCGLGEVQIIQKINNGEKSLSVVYNEILEEIKKSFLQHQSELFEDSDGNIRQFELYENISEFIYNFEENKKKKKEGKAKGVEKFIEELP